MSFLPSSRRSSGTGTGVCVCPPSRAAATELGRAIQRLTQSLVLEARRDASFAGRQKNALV